MSAINDDQRPVDSRARLLWQLVAGLKVRFAHERSFRLREGAIFPNRFLLTVSKESVGENRLKTIGELWRRMDMPAAFAVVAGRFLAAAHYIHFGYEENQASCLYKVYLEMGVRGDGVGGPEPVLLHLAFKWDPVEPERAAISRYFWYPGLSAPMMVERIAKIYADHDDKEPFLIARDIVLSSERRIVHGGLRYLEVTEDKNPRKSFDVNLYDAKILMAELSPFLERMCRHYSIPAERLQALLDQSASKAVGHLAGGTHRAGEDFFNVYHGVDERQGLGENIVV